MVLHPAYSVRATLLLSECSFEVSAGDAEEEPPRNNTTPRIPQKEAHDVRCGTRAERVVVAAATAADHDDGDHTNVVDVVAVVARSSWWLYFI